MSLIEGKLKDQIVRLAKKNKCAYNEIVAKIRLTEDDTVDTGNPMDGYIVHIEVYAHNAYVGNLDLLQDLLGIPMILGQATNGIFQMAKMTLCMALGALSKEYEASIEDVNVRISGYGAEDSSPRCMVYIGEDYKREFDLDSLSIGS